MAFVYVHILWFALWIILNTGIFRFPPLTGFDPFPFQFLTLVVSLEAIFLSTFVLIGQNNLGRLSERRADLDLQVNLLAEQKAAKTLEMLDSMAQQLDQMMRRFTYTPDPEVAALSISPNPEDVLKVIEDAVADETGEILKEVREKVADVTGEMKSVRSDVEEVRDRVEEVATDMDEMKERSGTQNKR